MRVQCSAPPIEPHRAAWHVTPGVTGWLKRRRLSRSARCRHPRVQGSRGGRPARRAQRSDPRRLAYAKGRWNAPRSSSNAPPFAGRCGNRRPSWRLVRRERLARRPVRPERARGSASRCTAPRDSEVCRAGSRRGDVPAERRRVPCSGRSGPSGDALSGACAARLVSPGFPREGRARGECDRGARQPSAQHEESTHPQWVPVRRRIAEVGRAPSGSEKRTTEIGRVESPPRSTERVNGSLTTHGLTRASAGARARQTEGGPSVCGDPHHVSVADRGRSCGSVRA